MNKTPVLYSFRRCPYAIRTRMTLKYCGVAVEHREVLLKDKPAAMLVASPKGTVPVLVQPDNTVLDESMDIIDWALTRHDPAGWRNYDAATLLAIRQLIDDTENRFKPELDRYKYNYHPKDDVRSAERNVHRAACVSFLSGLNARLCTSGYLFGERLSIADIAVFPFVRQFANVEPDWFGAQPLPHLQRWLDSLLSSELFLGVMQKHPLWLGEGLPEELSGQPADQAG